MLASLVAKGQQGSAPAGNMERGKTKDQSRPLLPKAVLYILHHPGLYHHPSLYKHSVENRDYAYTHYAHFSLHQLREHPIWHPSKGMRYPRL